MESWQDLVLEQKLTAQKISLLQLGDKHPVACRRDWEWAARESLGMEERMRAWAGAAVGGMSHPTKAGR